MENLNTFLELINSLSPLAIIALLGITIFLLVYKHPFRDVVKPLESSLDEVKSNHLHELPELVKNSRQTVEVLQRIEVKLSEDFSYLRARLNGKQQ